MGIVLLNFVKSVLIFSNCPVINIKNDNYIKKNK